MIEQNVAGESQADALPGIFGIEKRIEWLVPISNWLTKSVLM